MLSSSSERNSVYIDSLKPAVRIQKANSIASIGVKLKNLTLSRSGSISTTRKGRDGYNELYKDLKSTETGLRTWAAEKSEMCDSQDGDHGLSDPMLQLKWEDYRSILRQKLKSSEDGGSNLRLSHSSPSLKSAETEAKFTLKHVRTQSTKSLLNISSAPCSQHVATPSSRINRARSRTRTKSLSRSLSSKFISYKDTEHSAIEQAELVVAPPLYKSETEAFAASLSRLQRVLGHVDTQILEQLLTAADGNEFVAIRLWLSKGGSVQNAQKEDLRRSDIEKESQDNHSSTTADSGFIDEGVPESNIARIQDTEIPQNANSRSSVGRLNRKLPDFTPTTY